MKRRLEQFCREEHLLEPGMGVVIGVSGGADSICLLTMLAQLRQDWKLRLTAVHVHHGIRGAEADGDMARVQEICRELEIECICFKEDIPAAAKRDGLSMEEAGRKARYRLFEEVRSEKNYDCIAVAHHMDDQAETVLMNLLRGSGLRGLAGIRPKRDRIIRPLLCFRRYEIETWLKKQEISWCTDSTNKENDYLRNRIRNQLIPTLSKEYNERAVEHITDVAKDMAEADACFRAEAEKILDRSGYALDRRLCANQQTAGEDPIREQILGDREWVIGLLKQPEIRLDRSLFETVPHILAVYLIRQSLIRLGAGLKDVSRIHLEAVIGLAKGQSGKSMRLPGNVFVLVSGEHLVLTVGEHVHEPEFAAEISVISSQNRKKTAQNYCVNWFDYDKIKKGAVLRHRMPQDRIFLNNGCSRKLKEYLIDVKMPVDMRDRWPVFAVDHRVIWIPGYRMDDEWKAGPESERILEITLYNKRGGDYEREN